MVDEEGNPMTYTAYATKKDKNWARQRAAELRMSAEETTEFVSKYPDYHMISSTEAASDLTGVRYYAYKHLNMDPAEEMTEEKFDQLYEYYQEQKNEGNDSINMNRFFERYKKEDAIHIMNTVAEGEQEEEIVETAIAKTGGVVNYQTKGQLQKYGENATDEEKRNYWLGLNSDKNFVQRILKPDLNHGKEIPHPKTGLLMSHYMESGEINGMPVVYPRVIEVPGENRFHYFETTEEAQAYAEQTGEYIVTDSHEEAIWLAEDNYKTPEFIRAYGPTEHKKQTGGFWHIEKPKKKTYQTGGAEEEEEKEYTLSRAGRSAEDDLLDKQFLKKIAMQIVDERKGDISQEEALKKVEFLMNYVGRQESYYNPELNSSGNLSYIPIGVTNKTTQKHPATGTYHFKPEGLKTAMQRTRNFIGNNFYEESKNYGFIDENAEAGSKFNPYWFVDLQDHMDPNQLTKTQQDILILLDWAEGDAKLTDYIQGNINEVDFYMHGHHRGERGKNYDENLKNEIKSKATGVFEAYESEVKSGNYSNYSLFDGAGDENLKNLFLKEGYKNKNISGFFKNYKRIKEINNYQTEGFLHHPVDNTYVNMPKIDKQFTQNINMDKNQNNIVSNFEFLLASNKIQDDEYGTWSYKKDIKKALLSKGYVNPTIKLNPNDLSGAWIGSNWMTDDDIFGSASSSSSVTGNIISINDDPLLQDINNDSEDTSVTNLDATRNISTENELLNSVESSDWINSPSFMRRSKRNQYVLHKGQNRPIFETRSGFTFRKYRGKNI